jgi:hypothetical protein
LESKVSAFLNDGLSGDELRHWIDGILPSLDKGDDVVSLKLAEDVWAAHARLRNKDISEAEYRRRVRDALARALHDDGHVFLLEALEERLSRLAEKAVPPVIFSSNDTDIRIFLTHGRRTRRTVMNAPYLRGGATGVYPASPDEAIYFQHRGPTTVHSPLDTQSVIKAG